MQRANAVHRIHPDIYFAALKCNERLSSAVVAGDELEFRSGDPIENKRRLCRHIVQPRRSDRDLALAGVVERAHSRFL